MQAIEAYGLAAKHSTSPVIKAEVADKVKVLGRLTRKRQQPQERQDVKAKQ